MLLLVVRFYLMVITDVLVNFDAVLQALMPPHRLPLCSVSNRALVTTSFPSFQQAHAPSAVRR